MKAKSWPALMAMAILTAGYGTAASSRPDMASVRLSATPQNAGRVAQATLVPQGNGTAIELLVSGVPSYTTMPPHIYTFVYPGTCGSLGAKPAYVLNRRVILGDYVPNREMMMSKFVPVPISELISSDYALVLRTSPADGNVDIFCGNLKRPS